MSQCHLNPDRAKADTPNASNATLVPTPSGARPFGPRRVRRRLHDERPQAPDGCVGTTIPGCPAGLGVVPPAGPAGAHRAHLRALRVAGSTGSRAPDPGHAAVDRVPLAARAPVLAAGDLAAGRIAGTSRGERRRRSLAGTPAPVHPVPRRPARDDAGSGHHARGDRHDRLGRARDHDQQTHARRPVHAAMGSRPLPCARGISAAGAHSRSCGTRANEQRAGPPARAGFRSMGGCQPLR